MRTLAFGLFALFLMSGASSVSAAESSPPSEASIRELLEATHAHKLVDTMMSQMDGLLRKSVQQAMSGQPVDAGEQKIIDTQITKLNDLLKQQMSWDKMEPMYIDLYRQTFTQKEVNDILAFYRTPSGQSMIEKMPVLMTRVMQTAQSMVATLMPQLQKINRDTVSALQAYEARKTVAPGRAPNTAASSGK
jgi:hypothetical protein